MANEEGHWSYDDEIPDGTSWEDILDDLRWLSRKCATHSQVYFGMLEMMSLKPEIGGAERDTTLLRLAVGGKEHAKALSIYLDRISEYVVRMRDKNNKD
jgi:hypothetical protein